MFHSIVTRRVKKEDDQFVTRMTFSSSSIKDIIIERDAAGIPIKGWLTLDTITEGENTAITFTREHNEYELDMLTQLAIGLEHCVSYFKDEQGNVFPFDKILYADANKSGFVLAPGINITLHPTSEWPQFIRDYTNWLDLNK